MLICTNLVDIDKSNSLYTRMIVMSLDVSKKKSRLQENYEQLELVM